MEMPGVVTNLGHADTVGMSIATVLGAIRFWHRGDQVVQQIDLNRKVSEVSPISVESS